MFISAPVCYSARRTFSMQLRLFVACHILQGSGVGGGKRWVGHCRLANCYSHFFELDMCLVLRQERLQAASFLMHSSNNYLDHIMHPVGVAVSLHNDCPFYPIPH